MGIQFEIVPIGGGGSSSTSLPDSLPVPLGSCHTTLSNGIHYPSTPFALVVVLAAVRAKAKDTDRFILRRL